MRLVAVVLENFRRYRDRTVVPVARMTGLVGRNDVGKSTILEALDVFFDGGVKKIEPADASVDGDASQVRIGCVFEGLPTHLTLDASATTSLADEYLLNAAGQLEIHKVWNLSGTKATAPRVFARALHPTAAPAAGLLGQKNKALKDVVKKLGIEVDCALDENPSMRHAVYRHVAANGTLGLAEIDVALSSEDGEAVWKVLQAYLPIFALFQSDRESTDQDREVQDPMRVAVRRALTETDVVAKLNDVARRVEALATETATRTLEQLQAAYPDIAGTLRPAFRKPAWDTLFKMDLASDAEIPLNKRGSGVRRLVLLSFFQAEVARKRTELAAGGAGRPVIYAIEEPETSQHPDNQRLIVEALKAVAAAGDQVLMTTHTPALAGMLPLDGLCFIDTDPATGRPRLRTGTEGIYQEIAAALGVLPLAGAHAPGLRNFPAVAVCVEGPTDELALKALGVTLMTAGHIAFDICSPKIFWAPAGGDTLQAWVERRYLDTLNIPQIYIFDSDRMAADEPLKKSKQRIVDALAGRPDCTVFVTRKREIENYCGVAALARASDGRVVLAAGVDLDYGDMESLVDQAIGAAIRGGHHGFAPVDADGVRIAPRDVKKVICGCVMRHMTAAEVLERCAYSDETGRERHEVLEWMSAIAAYVPAATAVAAE